jgi:hypothetical protein
MLRFVAMTILGALGLGIAASACGDDDDPVAGPPGGYASSDTCRLDPRSCYGGAGTLCRGDYDCNAGLFCCRDRSNCNGGMCTIRCGSDRDCPSDMRCEHSMCFYACAHDTDCAPGMYCEHGHTICEWP